MALDRERLDWEAMQHAQITNYSTEELLARLNAEMNEEAQRAHYRHLLSQEVLRRLNGSAILSRRGIEELY